MAVTAVVSIVLDLTLFGEGSYVLGWLMIVILMIVPASIARFAGWAPMNKALGGIWCFVIILIWSVVRAIGSDPQHPPGNSLAYIGGLVLCWRLLTLKAKPEELTSKEAQTSAGCEEPNSPF